MRNNNFEIDELQTNELFQGKNNSRGFVQEDLSVLTKRILKNLKGSMTVMALSDKLQIPEETTYSILKSLDIGGSVELMGVQDPHLFPRSYKGNFVYQRVSKYSLKKLFS